MPAEPRNPKVFVSYSHDSDEHREWVLGLSERLRKEGFETMIDQYVQGTPLQGWPRWIENQIDWAEFVLVVCTEPYHRRFRGIEEGVGGRGVDLEGALISADLYISKQRSTKFVPVLRAASDEKLIPSILRVAARYLPSEKESFGLAALEAMACEVPVISSNTGGLPELQVQGETGFMSNIGDIDDMTRKALFCQIIRLT